MTPARRSPAFAITLCAVATASPATYTVPIRDVVGEGCEDGDDQVEAARDPREALL